MKLMYDGEAVLANGGGGKPAMPVITLTAAGWGDHNTQTVTVPGVLSDESAQLIFPTPAAASQVDFYKANIQCIAQAENALTFNANKTPAVDLTVYVGILEVQSGNL